MNGCVSNFQIEMHDGRGAHLQFPARTSSKRGPRCNRTAPWLWRVPSLYWVELLPGDMLCELREVQFPVQAVGSIKVKKMQQILEPHSVMVVLLIRIMITATAPGSSSPSVCEIL